MGKDKHGADTEEGIGASNSTNERHPRDLSPDEQELKNEVRFFVQNSSRLRELPLEEEERVLRASFSGRQLERILKTRRLMRQHMQEWFSSTSR